MRKLSEETKRKRQETFRKHMYEKAESEIGKKYNHLTVISINYEKTEKQNYEGHNYGVYMNFQCDCGNNETLTRRLNLVKQGKIKSCGCARFNNPLNFEDLTGKKFGRLNVIKRDIERDRLEMESDKKRCNVHWLCLCDCGNPEFRSVTGHQLKSGHTQSCGCYASEQIVARNKKYSTKINKYEVNGDITYLYDENDNKCVIDTEDYDIVKQWYWRKEPKRGDIDKGYWITNVKIDDNLNKKILFLHQVVAKIKYGDYDKSLVLDHLKRCGGDDNRKCNLYLKSNIDNSHNRSLSKTNSSGKTGVSFNKNKNKYIAYIMNNYKRIYLGQYDDFEEAVKIRKEAELKYGFTCDDVTPEYDEAGV